MRQSHHQPLTHQASREAGISRGVWKAAESCHTASRPSGPWGGPLLPLALYSGPSGCWGSAAW